MNIIYRDDLELRIDKFLAQQQIKELYSRNFIDSLIETGFIRVNGKKIKKSHLLKRNDRIDISIPPNQEPEIEPENIPLDIIFEDEFLIVVNKQAGITVHPAPGNPCHTMVNGLIYHLKGNISQGSDKMRPGIVHRLDKNTSGLIVVAKDNRTHSLLSRMFHNRNIEKHYKAVVVGKPLEKQGLIKTFLDRSKTNRKKITVALKGKEAITRYKVEEYFDYFSLLDIKLETGRTHQIRVHLSHINCPILGDSTYSNLKRTLSMVPVEYHKKVKNLLKNHLGRQALHAYKLSFIHPVTNRELNLTADYPEDLEYTVNWLRTNFS